MDEPVRVRGVIGLEEHYSAIAALETRVREAEAERDDLQARLTRVVLAYDRKLGELGKAEAQAQELSEALKQIERVTSAALEQK